VLVRGTGGAIHAASEYAGDCAPTHCGF